MNFLKGAYFDFDFTQLITMYIVERGKKIHVVTEMEQIEMEFQQYNCDAVREN